MQTRRGFLGALGVTSAVSLAGCALIEDTFEESAAPAGVPEETLESTGFEHRTTEQLSFEQTVTALGQSRELRLTNWLVTYGKELEAFGPDAVRFRLFSTPSITVAGSELNPFDSFDDEELFGEVTGSSDDDLDDEGAETVETLGDNVTYNRYATVQEIGEESFTAYTHIGRFSNDGDLLAAIATYPEVLDESENIYELATAIEHPAAFERERYQTV